MPALSEHADGIGYVHHTAWEETYRGLMPDGFLDSRTLKDSIARSRAYPGDRLVLLADGQVVGFACFYEDARGFTGRADEASEIAAFYLLKSHQGRGYGRLLMESCLSRLPREKVILYVLKGNERAIGFYRHMGFAETGKTMTQETGFGEICELEMMLKRDDASRHEWETRDSK